MTRSRSGRISTAATALLAAACAASPASPAAACAASPASPAPPGPSPTPAPSASSAPGPSSVPSSTPSPLGPWIGFQAGGGLARVQPDGSGLNVIIPNGTVPEPAHLDWAPDGRLAFQAGTDGSWDIWIADADGSTPHVLYDCVAPCINADAPAWSPDGASIAFSQLDEVGDDLPCTLQVIDVATGEISAVAEVPSGFYVTDPRWSPDGRALVVTYEDHRGANGELVEHPVGSRIAVIEPDDPTPAFTFLTESGMQASYPDWHPSDDVILFQAGTSIWWDAIGDSGGNLYTIRPDGSDLQQLTSLGPTDRAIWLPTWSTDGASILVTLTVRATRDNTVARLLADGSGLFDLPGPVAGAHPRQQRAKPGG